MKLETKILMQALYQSLLIGILLKEHPEPTDEEIKIFLVDALIEAKNDNEREAIEKLTVELVRGGIQRHQELEVIIKPIFEKDSKE